MTAVAAISHARRAAFRILLAVERGKAHSDELLRRQQVSELEAADRNLTTALVLGVLRWQILLDELVRPLLKRPRAKLEAEVLIALRMGAFQLHFLDRIPAHAAIDESVELTKQSGHRFAAKMVNAVLRNVARTAAAIGVSEETHADPAWARAHPVRMMERWAQFYGLEAVRAICRHRQIQPPLTLRIEGPAEGELTEAGVRLQPGALIAASRGVLAGDVIATAAFCDGRVRLQDEGSQLIGELAAACASDTPAGDQKKILDACAAPGGKTLILAARTREARIVACESNPQRLGQMRKRLSADAGRVEFRLVDAANLAEKSAFDFALADVPCSGTGTLGRNPEIRHRLHQGDLRRHAERQRAILLAALRAVRAGGKVLYSTCSLEPEENEQVVAAVLAENPSARSISLLPMMEVLDRDGILALGAAEGLRKCLTPEGALRLLPGAFETDGFFAALIDKAV